MFCKRIEANKIEPIRSNLSRSAITGLSKDAVYPFVGAGIRSNYSKSMQVKQGEQYVLVVNNAKKAGGNHTLVLHFEQPPSTPIIKDEPVAIKNQLSFSVLLKNKKTNKSLVGNIIIEGLRTKQIEKSNITSYQVDVPKRRYKLTVNANSKGFLLQSLEVNIPLTRSKMELEILLEPIEKGRKINLKNIQFYGNKATFLPQATPDLSALLEFMQLNENVKIEIEGHVNGPGQKNSQDYQQLSEDRANAVKKYLIQNKIDSGRIQFIGYGNTQMLFPTPKSEAEMSANRRVEIKIL
jgi:outer membrane protein OmpA-like peptidoglycan-associated protein